MLIDDILKENEILNKAEKVPSVTGSSLLHLIVAQPVEQLLDYLFKNVSHLVK